MSTKTKIPEQENIRRNTEKTRSLCPSMMCANHEKLVDEVQALDAAGVDIFHMDIMDGMFVPNFAMGLEDFKVVRKHTDKLVDAHLMISNPYEYVEMFADMGADIIYVHPETDKYPIRTIERIKNKGKIPGIAINPETSLETVKELFPLIDYLMIMTVPAGFSGQKFMDSVLTKIADTANYKEKYGFTLMADGAISPEKIRELSDFQVDGFVLGTSALFGKEEDYQTLVSKLRNI